MQSSAALLAELDEYYSDPSVQVSPATGLTNDLEEIFALESPIPAIRFSLFGGPMPSTTNRKQDATMREVAARHHARGERIDALTILDELSRLRSLAHAHLSDSNLSVKHSFDVELNIMNLLLTKKDGEWTMSDLAALDFDLAQSYEHIRLPATADTPVGWLERQQERKPLYAHAQRLVEEYRGKRQQCVYAVVQMRVEKYLAEKFRDQIEVTTAAQSALLLDLEESLEDVIRVENRYRSFERSTAEYLPQRDFEHSPFVAIRRAYGNSLDTTRNLSFHSDYSLSLNAAEYRRHALDIIYSKEPNQKKLTVSPLDVAYWNVSEERRYLSAADIFKTHRFGAPLLLFESVKFHVTVGRLSVYMPRAFDYTVRENMIKFFGDLNWVAKHYAGTALARAAQKALQEGEGEFSSAHWERKLMRGHPLNESLMEDYRDELTVLEIPLVGENESDQILLTRENLASINVEAQLLPLLERALRCRTSARVRPSSVKPLTTASSRVTLHTHCLEFSRVLAQERVPMQIVRKLQSLTTFHPFESRVREEVPLQWLVNEKLEKLSPTEQPASYSSSSSYGVPDRPNSDRLLDFPDLGALRSDLEHHSALEPGRVSSADLARSRKIAQLIQAKEFAKIAHATARDKATAKRTKRELDEATRALSIALEDAPPTVPKKLALLDRNLSPFFHTQSRGQIPPEKEWRTTLFRAPLADFSGNFFRTWWQSTMLREAVHYGKCEEYSALLQHMQMLAEKQPRPVFVRCRRLNHVVLLELPLIKDEAKLRGQSKLLDLSFITPEEEHSLTMAAQDGEKSRIGLIYRAMQWLRFDVFRAFANDHMDLDEWYQDLDLCTEAPTAEEADFKYELAKTASIRPQLWFAEEMDSPPDVKHYKPRFFRTLDKQDGLFAEFWKLFRALALRKRRLYRDTPLYCWYGNAARVHAVSRRLLWTVFKQERLPDIELPRSRHRNLATEEGPEGEELEETTASSDAEAQRKVLSDHDDNKMLARIAMAFKSVLRPLLLYNTEFGLTSMLSDSERVVAVLPPEARPVQLNILAANVLKMAALDLAHSLCTKAIQYAAEAGVPFLKKETVTSRSKNVRVQRIQYIGAPGVEPPMYEFHVMIDSTRAVESQASVYPIHARGERWLKKDGRYESGAEALLHTQAERERHFRDTYNARADVFFDLAHLGRFGAFLREMQVASEVFYENARDKNRVGERFGTLENYLCVYFFGQTYDNMQADLVAELLETRHSHHNCLILKQHFSDPNMHPDLLLIRPLFVDCTYFRPPLEQMGRFANSSLLVRADAPTTDQWRLQLADAWKTVRERMQLYRQTTEAIQALVHGRKQVVALSLEREKTIPLSAAQEAELATLVARQKALDHEISRFIHERLAVALRLSQAQEPNAIFTGDEEELYYTLATLARGRVFAEAQMLLQATKSDPMIVEKTTSTKATQPFNKSVILESSRGSGDEESWL
jgi:hypothetical protein